ncbi:hypothetical protein ACJIZ3_018736 [Penstemon smallii]|uniref:Uncharacterized protein n=1 Tax=Penstemon smallii TaxID=265156 RepID=A0ABD3SZ63_9LAMI
MDKERVEGGQLPTNIWFKRPNTVDTNSSSDIRWSKQCHQIKCMMTASKPRDGTKQPPCTVVHHSENPVPKFPEELYIPHKEIRMRKFI